MNVCLRPCKGSVTTTNTVYSSKLRAKVIRAGCGEGENDKVVGSQAIRACVALWGMIRVSVSDVLYLSHVSEQKQSFQQNLNICSLKLVIVGIFRAQKSVVISHNVFP